MFTHKHYVPILKTKAGERWAIDHLTLAAKARLTPLFEIHQHKDTASADHAEDMCDGLASVWGTASAFFLDTVWLHGVTGDSTIIQKTFDYARTLSLPAIPVIRVSYDQATLDVIQDIVTQDKRGCMIRLPSTDAPGAAAAINGVVQYLKVDRDQIDLMLDYRTHPMTLAADVPQLPTINEWRTFSAASGSFPRSLAQYTLNEWHPITRHDWNSWLTGITGGNLIRNPAFADYTMRDPGPPAGGGDPSVTLKYTIADRWLVRIGRKFQAGFSTDIHGICASLEPVMHFGVPVDRAAAR
jgi:hypothetical protein